MSRLLTILLPNYRTPDLTKFCLRSLKKYTDLNKVEVLAIDNDSRDASTEYLRSLKWIRLFERPRHDDETPPEMHSRSLDEALEMVDTPFVLVMHTDTIVIDPGWLDFLLGKITADDNIAGVGSWKLEYVSPWKHFLKSAEKLIKKVFFPDEKELRYLRSHCALYRTELLKKHTRGFFDGVTAGASAHRMLEEAGYRMLFIESEELNKYVRHLNHATMILNREISGRRTGKPAARQRIAEELEQLKYHEVLADDSLD